MILSLPGRWKVRIISWPWDILKRARKYVESNLRNFGEFLIFLFVIPCLNQPTSLLNGELYPFLFLKWLRKTGSTVSNSSKAFHWVFDDILIFFLTRLFQSSMDERTTNHLRNVPNNTVCFIVKTWAPAHQVDEFGDHGGDDGWCWWWKSLV